MKRICVLILSLAAACAAQHGATGDDDDGDGSGSGSGSNPGSGSGSGIGSGSGACGDGVACDGGLPCTPNTFSCGSAGDVEVCNNSGTAWLFVQACADGCSAGVCEDPTCTPGATRCQGNEVETCAANGSSWTDTDACSTYCADGECALPSQTVSSNSTSSGTVIVAGDFVVTNNSTLTADTGDLTIIADNIRIDAGAAIAVAPTSTGSAGASCELEEYNYEYGYYYVTEYANYGEQSGSFTAAYGGENESGIQGGGFGGATGQWGCNSSQPVTTFGGGTIHLIATHDITIAGQILAPGAPAASGDPSGGAGGGVQLAGDTIEITGSISANGGAVSGTAAGWGRVRILYGTSITNTGTIIGDITQGRRPPIDVTSPTQPDPALVYNDDFDTLTIAHERPFSTAQGYLHSIDTTQYNLPTAATGVFSAVESFGVDSSLLVQGQNYIHVIPVDASSALGTVETTFPVQLNTLAPTAQSTSHPDASTWYPDVNPYFTWTLPAADASFTRVHYVFDNFGDTVPTLTDTALPAVQQQLLLSNVAQGIWCLHVVSEDTVGHLTKAAANVVVRVGTDPGTGTVFGSVFDENNQPVVGALVRVNRGIFEGTTTTGGAYSIAGVSAGTWEISVEYSLHHVAPQTLTVTSGGSSSANFNLVHN